TADRAVAVELSLPETKDPDAAAQVGFSRRLLTAMSDVPGVASSAVATALPMSGNDMGIGFAVEGHPPADPKERRAAAYFAVSPAYFSTMGIRLVPGRPFTDRDTAAAPNVAIVSETVARRVWRGGNATGECLPVP